ncbi:membrane protein [Microlunatus endophyticus]|uniref:Membrane protein n=1 Tax=Microlunatus endophyticus TaxID=1716077 RepID=A0A917SCT4_9ACTN|nr:glycosyltransferase 87 family protein [Microlunatus endophyticus]GGL69043.1 membrane protein [Microlunatus endophyticus]
MSAGAGVPASKDPVLAVLSRRFGGLPGRHAGRSLSWWTARRISLLAATLLWIVGALQKLPCRSTIAGVYPDTYKYLCYSDIPLLYTARGLADGNIPYFDHGNYQTLEYPVLIGYLLEFQRRITVLFGAPVGPGLDTQQALDASNLFATVNLVVLGVLFLITVWAHTRTIPADLAQGRSWDAMMIAISPMVLLAGFINWDFLAVALTALGFMFWGRRRPGLAAVMFGLGTAAKLYPVLFLGPLILLCLRRQKMREFGRLMIGFAVAWLVPNLPVMIFAPDQWLVFWTFNSDRTGDLGSIWYVFSLAGHPVPHLNVINTVILVLLCAGIGWLIFAARRPPRFGQLGYLVIAAFLITNKVYSPQYVLWLLPLLVLARPRWREWVIFTVGELGYFLAIWAHLDGTLTPGNGGPDKLYWLAVIFRIACEVWVGLVIIRDILVPDRYDPLRSAGAQGTVFYGTVADDPAGGVLRGAPDAPWVRRLHQWLASTG